MLNFLISCSLILPSLNSSELCPAQLSLFYYYSVILRIEQLGQAHLALLGLGFAKTVFEEKVQVLAKYISSIGKLILTNFAF